MKPSKPSRSRLLLILATLTVINLTVLVWIGLPLLRENGILPSNGPPEVTQVAAKMTVLSVTPSATLLLPANTPTDTAEPILLQQNGSPQENLDAQGVMVLAMRDGLNIHLFAYHPLYLPLTRLTNTPWDEMTPALSPDGTRLAYSARQNGYWDLFILDLSSGNITRVTDTPEFESSPTWSPDGLWLAYERFDGTNLDIFIQQVNPDDPQVVQLTSDPSVDRSPAWSPSGREIAFVSTRTGDEEIWLAQLDKIDDRFTNLSQSPQTRDRYPAWSGDGAHLAWSAEKGGDRRLTVWDATQPDRPTRLVGEGDQPVWTPDQQLLFTEVREPNFNGLAAYQVANGRLSLPLTPLPGLVYGTTWVRGPLPAWLIQQVEQGDHAEPQPLTHAILTRFPIEPLGRQSVVPLEDVTAPQPYLHDAVDEAFQDLRHQIGQETGWDALSSLENAYVALTTPLDPSFQEDWLYTGRAFNLNPLLLSAGWMNIAREDFGGQTYWHLYLKARYQDGSMGQPLPEMVWDLNARYSGDPRFFEDGGRLSQPPGGYWIDLTELTSRFGWERLPSQTNWRTFYPAICYNQFVMRGELDWSSAMAEIYPSEALVTTTPLPTYTPMPSDTPEEPSAPKAPTLTPTITPIPTRRPTWTPLPNP